MAKKKTKEIDWYKLTPEELHNLSDEEWEEFEKYEAMWD